MKRITRDRRLTPEEAARYKAVPEATTTPSTKSGRGSRLQASHAPPPSAEIHMGSTARQ